MGTVLSPMKDSGSELARELTLASNVSTRPPLWALAWSGKMSRVRLTSRTKVGIFLLPPAFIAAGRGPTAAAGAARHRARVRRLCHTTAPRIPEGREASAEGTQAVEERRGKGVKGGEVDPAKEALSRAKTG